MKRIFLTLLLLYTMVFIFKSHPSAVYFATNNIQLYENGKKVSNDSVVHDRDFQNPVCNNGVCSVGQQYEFVTFYKTSQNHIMNYSEWINNWYYTHESCEGFAKYGEEL